MKKNTNLIKIRNQLIYILEAEFQSGVTCLLDDDEDIYMYMTTRYLAYEESIITNENNRFDIINNINVIDASSLIHDYLKGIVKDLETLLFDPQYSNDLNKLKQLRANYDYLFVMDKTMKKRGTK